MAVRLRSADIAVRMRRADIAVRMPMRRESPAV